MNLKGIFLILIVAMSGSIFAANGPNQVKDFGKTAQAIKCQTDHFSAYVDNLKIDDAQLKQNVAKLQTDAENLAVLSNDANKSNFLQYLRATYIPDLKLAKNELMVWKKDHKSDIALLNSSQFSLPSPCEPIKKPAIAKTIPQKIKKVMKKFMPKSNGHAKPSTKSDPIVFP